MSRYTLIVLEDEASRAIRDRLREQLDMVVRIGSVYFPLNPNTYLVLSNGVGSREHREIHSRLVENRLNVKLASVLSNSPQLALLKAIKTLEKTSFYYEDGPEREYIFGYFTVKHRHYRELLDELTERRVILHNILLLLEYTGSLPLKICLNGILAVLSEEGVNELSRLSDRVDIKVVRSYLASVALGELASQDVCAVYS